MFYIILIILFIAVFALLFWRILMGHKPQQPEDKIDTYVCPECNETQCECHKVDDPD